MDARGQMMELQAQVEQLKSQMAEQVAAMAAARLGGGVEDTWGGLGLPVGDVGDGCFIVRWCEGADGSATGQWEIYLPPGCVAVGDACEPINRKASEGSGHDDEESEKYWYKLDIAGNATGRWRLRVHAKTSARITGEDGLADRGRHLFYVAAEEIANGEVDETSTAERNARMGDEFAQVVATAIAENVDGETVRRAEMHVTSAISVAQRPKKQFELVWYVSRAAQGGLQVDRVMCVRQAATVAGVVVAGETMTDVSAAKEEGMHEIAARLVTKGEGAGQTTIEVLVDANTAQTDDFEIWLPLYGVTESGETEDYRDTTLANLRIYR